MVAAGRPPIRPCFSFFLFAVARVVVGVVVGGDVQWRGRVRVLCNPCRSSLINNIYIVAQAMSSRVTVECGVFPYPIWWASSQGTDVGGEDAGLLSSSSGSFPSTCDAKEASNHLYNPRMCATRRASLFLHRKRHSSLRHGSNSAHTLHG